jgi:hypothetical protein
MDRSMVPRRIIYDYVTTFGSVDFKPGPASAAGWSAGGSVRAASVGALNESSRSRDRPISDDFDFRDNTNRNPPDRRCRSRGSGLPSVDQVEPLPIPVAAR